MSGTKETEAICYREIFSVFFFQLATMTQLKRICKYDSSECNALISRLSTTCHSETQKVNSNEMYSQTRVSHDDRSCVNSVQLQLAINSLAY